MAHEKVLSEIQSAIGAHGAWKLRLVTAINTGSSKISPEVVSCDNQCDFGKWLYNPAMPAEMLGSKPYKEVKILHAEFHKTAAIVLKSAIGGDTSKSKQLLDGAFTEQSKKLISALGAWKRELQAT